MHELYHQVQARAYGEAEFLHKWEDDMVPFIMKGYTKDEALEETYYTPNTLENDAEKFRIRMLNLVFPQ